MSTARRLYTTTALLLLACGLAPALAAAVPVAPGGERGFTATVYDQFGDPIADPGDSFSWNATGGSLDGSDTATTTYAAGETSGRYLIAVTVAGLSDSLELIIGGLRRIRLVDLPQHAWEHSGGGLAEAIDDSSVFVGLGEEADNRFDAVDTGDG